MANFTPINGSEAIYQSLSPSGHRAVKVHGARSDVSSTRSVVSENLGGTEDDTAETSIVPSSIENGTLDAGKEAGAREKRPAAIEHVANPKRRRIISIKGGLTIAKPDDGEQRVRNSQAKAPKTRKTKSAKVSGKISSDLLNRDVVKVVEESVANYTPGSAPTTTTRSLDSPSQRTSVESARASDGYGFTSYQRARHASIHTSIGDISPLWWSKSPESSRNASERISRPSLSSTSTVSRSVNDVNVPHDKFRGAVNPSEHRAAYIELQCKEAEESFKEVARAQSYNDESLSGSVVSNHETSPNSPGAIRLAKRRASVASWVLAPEEESAYAMDDSEDEALIDFTKSVELDIDAGAPAPRLRKRNIREVDEYEDYGGALLTAAEREALANLQTKKDLEHSPLVRRAFPAPVLDRSPILGVSQNTLLRTCFRVGEALNCGSHAVRSQTNVILELYARVVAAWREPGTRKQHFIFDDLYHAGKAPQLKGTFDLWNQSAIWDLDSSPFLHGEQGGTMCRMIAKMKRDGKEWRLEILSIWEATWEDIDYVAGIYDT